jgi:hypothetical protein
VEVIDEDEVGADAIDVVSSSAMVPCTMARLTHGVHEAQLHTSNFIERVGAACATGEFLIVKENS